MPFGSITGITLGVLAARFRDRHRTMLRLWALTGSSTPVFWSGLILLYIFPSSWDGCRGPGRLDARMSPPVGMTGFLTIDALLAGDMALFWDALHHLILPALVLGWTVMGIVSRLVRASMLTC